MSDQPRIVCITGASSGIGRSTAKKFAKDGWQVIVGARRTQRLGQLAEEIESYGLLPIRYFQLDVTSRENIGRFADHVREFATSGIDVLINNSGLALGIEKISDSTEAQLDGVIETNLKGAIRVLRSFLPDMIARQRGHIINIGSIAGFSVYEGGGYYCASKHALDAITRTLRLELNGTGIRVTSIDPGMVETEFSTVRFSGDKLRAEKVYQGMKPLTADDVANSIFFAASQPSHVNIDRIVMMPVDQASAFKVNRK